MEHDLDKLLGICLDAVYIAHGIVDASVEGGREAVEVKGKKEDVTKADLEVMKVWKGYFAKCGIPIQVLTEESRDDPFVTLANPVYIGVGDELDGTRNWKRARGILPYCAIFTIGINSPQIKFEDALVTAVLDHRNGDLWTAVKGKGCFYNGERVHTSGKKTLDKDTLIMIDRGPCPSPEHSLRYFNLEQKCGHGNFGCAGIHMAGVASGSVSGWDGYCCMIQKPEERLSGNLLIPEAGGVVLGDPNFNWNRTYEIIAGATTELAEEIRKEILPIEEARKLYQIMRSQSDQDFLV